MATRRVRSSRVLLSAVVAGNHTSFEYDADGDPTVTTFPTSTGEPDQSYSYSAYQLVRSGPAGAQISYAYNEADQLTTVTTTASYTYDGDGLRTTTTTTGTTHDTWNQATPVPLLLTDGTNDYLYRPDGTPIEQIDSTGTVTYLHTDPATGLIYLRARYYDPTTAAFLTPDPLTDTTHQPYEYANDDPINNTDPLGLFGLDTLIGAAVGAVVGGTTSIVEQEISGNGINWSKVGIATAVGAAGGAAATICGSCGLAVDNAIAGGVTAASNNIGNQLYDTGSIDSLKLASATTFGAVLGAVGGTILGPFGGDDAPATIQIMTGITTGMTGDDLSDWLNDSHSETGAVCTH